MIHGPTSNNLLSVGLYNFPGTRDFRSCTVLGLIAVLVPKPAIISRQDHGPVFVEVTTVISMGLGRQRLSAILLGGKEKYLKSSMLEASLP